MSRTIDLDLDADVYQRNAFRVTRLPVDASPRAIRRRRREHELGTIATEPGDPSDTRPSPTDLNRAFARLDDPRTRIVDELTWEWRDTAAPPHVSQESVSTHDDAVRAHRRALDLEARGTALTPDEVRQRDSAWETAMRGWRQVTGDPEVWSHLAHRTTELDDPRLDEEMIRELPARIVDRLLDISARLAVSEARAGRDPKRHRRAMSLLAPNSPSEVEGAMRRAAAPLIDRVDEACRVADNGDRADVQTGQTLIADTSASLEALRRVLFLEDPTYSRLADTVASLLRQVAVRRINDSQDPPRPGAPTDYVRVRAAVPDCQELLRQARSIVVGRQVRASIDQDIATVDGIAETAASRAGAQRTSRNGRAVVVALLGIAAILFSGALSYIAGGFFVYQGLQLATRTSRPGLVRAGVLAFAGVTAAVPLSPVSTLVGIAFLTVAGLAGSGAAGYDRYRWQGASWALGGTAVVVVALAWLAVPWVALLGVVAIAVGFVTVGRDEGTRVGLGASTVLGVTTLAIGIWGDGGVAAVVVGSALAGLSGLAALGANPA